MNPSSLNLVRSMLALALLVGGCASDDSGDPTATAAAAPSTTVAPTTTTTVPTTSTSTTTTTTTTTLSPEVRPPEPASAFRWKLDQSARISALGQIDEIVDATLEATVDHGSSDMTISFGILGFTFQVQIVTIDDESWVKEDLKPWRVNDGLWSMDSADLLGVGGEIGPVAGGGVDDAGDGDSSGVSYGEERDFYEGLSGLGFEVVDLEGTAARKYEIPTDLHVMALRIAGALETADESFLTETSDVELWLDAATDHVIRVTGEYRGGVELVSGIAADYGPDAVAKVSVDVEFTDIGSPSIVIAEPEVPVFDLPDGYLPFEETVTGASLVYPEDWVFVDTGTAGFAGTTMPFLLLDLETGSSINLVREDASALPGLTLDEYVDLSINGFRTFGMSVDVVDRRPFNLTDGTPAVLLKSVLPDEGRQMSQIILISGTFGYVVSLSGLVGMTDDHTEVLMESLLLEPPDGTNG